MTTAPKRNIVEIAPPSPHINCTNWKELLKNHTILMYIHARNWPWKLIYLKWECRWVHTIAFTNVHKSNGKKYLNFLLSSTIKFRTENENVKKDIKRKLINFRLQFILNKLGVNMFRVVMHECDIKNLLKNLLFKIP